MLVVADSSPLIALVNIQYVFVLQRLFDEVAVPASVALELRKPTRPKSVRDFIASPPDWISVRRASSPTPIPGIDSGEEEAINLALELKAHLLLIDDVAGRKAARRHNVRVTGTIGVLERAADQGLLNLEEAFGRLRRTDFWIDERILDARLQLHLRTRHPEER
jgi:predicted nucleic acid-binding protein